MSINYKSIFSTVLQLTIAWIFSSVINDYLSLIRQRSVMIDNNYPSYCKTALITNMTDVKCIENYNGGMLTGMIIMRDGNYRSFELVSSDSGCKYGSFYNEHDGLKWECNHFRDSGCHNATVEQIDNDTHKWTCDYYNYDNNGNQYMKKIDDTYETGHTFLSSVSNDATPTFINTNDVILNETLVGRIEAF